MEIWITTGIWIWSSIMSICQLLSTVAMQPHCILTAAGCKVKLEGAPPNTFGVGTQVSVWANGTQWYAEQFLQRSFQSSVDPVLHFGFTGPLDSVVVQWAHGDRQVITDIKHNSRLTISEIQ